MAQQCEETRDGESLITIPYHLKVDRVLIKVVGKKRYNGIYRDHEEDSYDMPLLPGLQVVGAMAPDQVP